MPQLDLSPKSYSAWLDAKKLSGRQDPDESMAGMPPGMAPATTADAAKTLAANPKAVSTPASAQAPTGEIPGIHTAGSEQSPLDGSTRQVAQDTGAVNGGIQTIAGGTMAVVPTTETETKTPNAATKTGLSKTSTVSPLTAEAFNTAQGQAMSTPGIQAMMADQGRLRAASDPYFKAAAAGGAGLDLTPLMTLGDSLYGTKTAQNYVSPMARLQALGNISKTLGEGNKALSDADVAMLGQNLKNTTEGGNTTVTNPGVTTVTQKPVVESLLGALNFGKSIENKAAEDAGKEVKEQELDMGMNESLKNLAPLLSKYSGSDGPQFILQKAVNNLSPMAAKLVPKNLPITSPVVINALEQLGSLTHEQAQDARDYGLYMGQVVNGMNSAEFKSRQTAVEQGITKNLTGNVAGANMETVRKALGTATTILQKRTAAREGTLTPEGRAKLATNPYALKAGAINYDFSDPTAKAAPAVGGINASAAPQVPMAPAPVAGQGTATAAPQAQQPRPQRSKSTGLVRWMQVGPDGVDREVPAPNGR